MRTLLSPKELALTIGVSESTLKRWADEGLVQFTRTAGGHRRIPLAEALRFVRENKATIVRPDILDMNELVTAQADKSAGRSPDESLHQALLVGDAPRARGLILASYLAGHPIASVCDGPIRLALQKLGELWKQDGQGILIEHRAIDICVQAVNQLRTLIPAPPEDAPLALGGAAESDPYLLPSLMAATALADLGYREVNFGPCTPVDTLIRAADNHLPRLVWYTCSSAPHEQRLRDDTRKLADALAQRKIWLVLGGRATAHLDLTGRPHLYLGQSMAELTAFAKGLLA